jgi:hypothetical protein
MGKAFFLRKDKKLYTEGSHLYLTTPDGVKISKDQNLNAKNVLLQFFHRRVPHKMDCRIVGRFRLLPEVGETLDFSAKAAYKLIPTSSLKKEDKRQFLRYTLKNYGDSRIPLTTHIMFRPCREDDQQGVRARGGAGDSAKRSRSQELPRR